MKFIESNLSDIAAEVKTGKTPSTLIAEYFGDEINWYTPGDLDKGKYLGKSVRGITHKAIADKKASIFRPNTILIGCIGDIGKVGITKEVCSANQQITGVLTIDKKVCSEFLFYWLKRNKKILQNASANAIVPILNNKQLGMIKIYHPILISDQIYIADILTKAENLITQRKESIRLLDEYLKSTFLEMFGDQNEKRFSPETLDSVSLKITDGEHGKVNQIEKGRLYLMARNITVINSLDLSDISFISEEDHNKIFKRCNPQAGDILLVCVGATIGKVALVPKNMEDFSIARSVALIKPNRKKLDSQYLLWFFNSDFAKRQLKNSSKAAAQAGLYTGKIKQIEIPVPPIQLQNEFGLIAEKTEKLKIEYRRSLQELETLYKCLSQRAFKGELKIKEAKKVKVNIQLGDEEKRDLLGGYLISKADLSKGFGHIKLVKHLVTAEYYAETPMPTKYQQHNNGPYDVEFMKGLPYRLKKKEWFEEYAIGSGFGYKRLEKADEIEGLVEEVFADKKEEIDFVVNLMNKTKSDQAEIVATVYAVWNDLLLNQLEVNADEIKKYFFKWSDHKKKTFKPKQVEDCYKWMQQQNFIPKGTGNIIMRLL